MIKEAKTLLFYSWYSSPTISTISYTEEKDLEDNKKIIDSIKASGSVEDSDAVFFHTSSRIPRYKFSKYCEDKKTKRVINIDKATACVVSTDYLKSYLDITRHGSEHNYYIFTGRDIKQWMGFTLKGELLDEDTVLVNESVYKTMESKFPVTPSSNLKSHSLFILNSWRIEEVMKAVESCSDFEKVINRGIKLVDDEVLNKQMADGSIIVDNANFQEFSQMLNSRDEPTIQVAMELLANSDYEKSYFHIGLLLNKFKNIAYKYTNKSVNLRNFFEYFKDLNWNQERSKFLVSLRKTLTKSNNITQEQEECIREELLEFVNKSIEYLGLKTQEIYFKDEFKKKDRQL